MALTKQSRFLFPQVVFSSYSASYSENVKKSKILIPSTVRGRGEVAGGGVGGRLRRALSSSIGRGRISDFGATWISCLPTLSAARLCFLRLPSRSVARSTDNIWYKQLGLLK